MGRKYDREHIGGAECRDDNHLCRIASRRDFDCIRELVKDPEYFCRKCGRAAHSPENLCKPDKL